MSQNKNNEPSPEERKRVVDAALKLIRNDDKQKALNELEQIGAAKQKAIQNVRLRMVPIFEQAKMEPVTSPFYLHSESGRISLLETAVKFFMDELRTFSKEEALFCLAFAYAENLMGEQV